MIEHLMEKYLDRNCTEQEIVQLLEYFNHPQNESSLKAVITQYFVDEAAKVQHNETIEAAAIDDVHSRLMADIKEKKTKVIRMQWLRMSAAASVLVLMSLVTYFYFIAPNNLRTISDGQNPTTETDVRNETSSLLDSAELLLSRGEHTTILQQSDQVVTGSAGKEKLALSESVKVGNVSYNRVTIPRGGQHKLTLPDGTKVLLNAASTIAFPASFTGKERRVKITGEVYFEVEQIALADDKGKMPFIVGVNNDVEIKVLGTHFNVNSYPDDDGAIKTTLLEGSVEVLSLETNQKYVLKPGQQAIISKLGDLSVMEVNTEEVIAWKNGYFYFNNSQLQNIMLQLARWYDVKVIYEGSIPERKFTGKIYKDLDLNEVIELLKFTKINIRVEDNCIIVTP